ncbi:type II toxin-antitoxin system HicA family toxin [Patescibacteria group bacterium]|nr:type II toxin-antitoxin system HicA family toxin [Patescibacteria group bacterium]MBU4512398.1 type II toxin-antitoxin system HicA family toxin [Patescibacteria group bacterium]MCG2692972.1 type II toxin-antitoxin system HicA family toxin [Candidatus Parcubacteria bacterium]
MPKLPVVSGKQATKVFEKVGYRITRQTGSHIRMHHNFDKTRNPLSIPNHKIIGKGLLRRLLRDAELPVAEFTNLLKK